MIKCPVPGCPTGDREVASDALYCPGCGLSLLRCASDVRRAVESLTEFLERPQNEVAEMLEFDRFEIEDPNYMRWFLRSPRHFRIGYPNRIFFRCWNCDLYGSQEQPPLARKQPERHLHSTADGDYLLPGLTLDSEYKERERLEEVFSRPNTTGIPDYLAHPDPQIEARWQAGQQHLRQTQQNEINRHPQRPDARQHSSCPHCNRSFPYVLRPSYSDPTRDPYLRPHTKPIAKVDQRLHVPVVDRTADSARQALDYYYITCGLPLNPLLVVRYETEYDFHWNDRRASKRIGSFEF